MSVNRSDNLKFSVVIPVYKSSLTIERNVTKVSESMTTFTESFEIILVDDCSGVNTWEAIKRISCDIPYVRAIRLGNNVGQWMATLCGIHKSKGEVIITIDDDLQNSVDDLQRLVGTLESESLDIVYGVSSNKGGRLCISRLLYQSRNTVLHFLFGKKRTESFKAFRRNVIFGTNLNQITNLHFEASAKIATHQRNVGYLEVDYVQSSVSRHGFMKKLVLLFKYGIEFYSQPRKMILVSAVIILLLIAFDVEVYLVLLGLNLVLLLFLLHVGILLYLKMKGAPDYVIMEEIGGK